MNIKKEESKTDKMMGVPYSFILGELIDSEGGIVVSISTLSFSAFER